MAWDIRKNGTTSIGDSVLPGLTAVRGMAAGRTGVVPWAGRLSLITDDLVLAIGDQVELLRNTDVEWTGDVRRLSQSVDRNVNAIRWRVGAEGRIAKIVLAEAGAATERYDGINIGDAITHTLEAIGIGSTDRDIGSSARILEYWQLLAAQRPWVEIQRLVATAGPRARLYEDRVGRIAFRDAALPAVSRTIYGVGMGMGARPILTDLQNVDAGRDRVINVARVPYAVTPAALGTSVRSSDWGSVDLADNPITATIDTESRETIDQLVVAGYGASASGPAGGMLPDFVAQRPDWVELYGETWSSDYGSTLVGSEDVTITTGHVTVNTSDGDSISTGTQPSAFYPLGTPASATFTASAPASATVNIPADATSVVVSVTGISARYLIIGSSSSLPRWLFGRTLDVVLSELDAGIYFVVSRAGQSIGVTPLPQTTYVDTSDLASLANVIVRRFTVTLRVTWTIGRIDSTWAGLYLGVMREQPNAALAVPAALNVEVRAALNALRLSFGNGIRPARTAVGDPVLAGTLLVAASVVESRIDDPVTITAPAGWTQVAGEPTGLDSIKTRRILFVATRAITADGTVPAAVWTATGPTNPVVRSVILAVGPARAVVWEDDLGPRSVVGIGDHALRVGPNTIKLRVTAEDGTTTETYTVVVTRAAT